MQAGRMGRQAAALLVGAMTALGASAGQVPRDDAALAQVVDQRLRGDRTGACLAVGVIDAGRVARVWRCADAQAAPRIGPQSAFEIGSITKTMLGLLLADGIAQGAFTLDDPLADHLPEGTVVPDFAGAPVLLRHLVTHTAGLPVLPPGMLILNPANPYQYLQPDTLLSALGQVTLDAAPGTQMTYSNFGAMLLSLVLTRHAGQSFQALLQERVLAPLQMHHTWVDTLPDDVQMAAGHSAADVPTPPWTFHPALAGVGGVRATLDDMLRYARAQLGQAPEALAPALGLSQQPVQTDAAQAMAMQWFLVPLAGGQALVHDGGTGGFTTFMAVDRVRGRAAVVLSDTSLGDLGGLSDLALHLLDPAMPLGAPRRQVPAPQALLEGLAGEYLVQGIMRVRLRQADGALYIQAQGQPELEMGYDDAGDFFPLGVGALLQPQRSASGRYSFLWRQGGGAMPAVRLGSDGRPEAADVEIAPEVLRDYAGHYRLGPDVTLVVRARDGVLYAQATNQGEFALAPVSEAVFEAVAFGIELHFQRDADGNVTGLALHQGGQVHQAARQ